MSISKHATYVRITGAPYLDRAQAYKTAKHAADEAWSKFATDRGATHYSGLTHLESLTFANPKARPEGWGQPSRRGRSFPNRSSKAGQAEIALIAALPKQPSAWDVFPEEEIPFQLNHKGPRDGDYGGGCFTGMWSPHVLWIADEFYGLIGDVASAAREWLKDHPGGTVDDNAEDWKIPPGLERVTEAEWEFAVAKYRLDQERKKAAE